MTREPLGRLEADFLARAGSLGVFSRRDAEQLLGPGRETYVHEFLSYLRAKGWIARVKPGLYAVIPLSSGTSRNPQLHEYLVAMRLVKPAAVAFFSAMNYHGLTEQLPRQVFVATDHKVKLNVRDALGFTFRIVGLRPSRFFGVRTEWINESPFQITDLEKTLVDGLALPEYCGGIGTVAAGLSEAWERVDQLRLHEYARRMGTSAVVKRLGYIQESLSLGDSEALRASVGLATGFPRLDPTLPPSGTHNRRWGLQLNVEVEP